MSKHDLSDMIITEKNQKIICTREDDGISKEKANEILKNIKTSQPKIQIIHKQIFLI